MEGKIQIAFPPTNSFDTNVHPIVAHSAIPEDGTNWGLPTSSPGFPLFDPKQDRR